MELPQHASPPPRHDPYVVWRNRDYALYAGGAFLMVLGKQAETVAVLWVVHQATGSALDLGLIGLVQALPVMLLALPAGQIADRFDRRRVLLVTLSLGVLGSLGLLGVVLAGASVRWFYLCLLAAAIGRALGQPARAAMLPQLVKPENFTTAVAWNSSLFQIASMTGPALGGMLVAWNVQAAFITSAACQVVMWMTVVLLRVRRPAVAVARVSIAGLIRGVRFVYSTKLILAAITLDMFAVLLGGATYLLPIFADDILGVGVRGQGWLRSAEAAGALCMAAWLAHRPPMRRAGRELLLAVTGFGLATILFGLSRWFWLSMLAMVLIGMFDNISVVIRHSLVQMLTPDSMRGRVSAVNGVFITASNDLGGLESGLSTHLFASLAWGMDWAESRLAARIMGTTASVLMGGIGTLCVVFSAARLWPQLRAIDGLSELKPVKDSEEILAEAMEEARQEAAQKA